MIVYYIAAAILFVIFSPLILKESSKIRYFACWASLGLMTALISTITLVSLPFTLNPRCCSNIKKGSLGSGIAAKIAGVQFEGRDLHKANICKRFIAVVNHQSFLDIIGMVKEWRILGNCVPVAKKSLLYYWPFGLLNWLIGTIFVDRNHKGGYSQMLQQAKKHFNKYQGKTSILIFPEGSRGHGITFKDFKKGAFQLAIDLRVPILPIVIAPFTFIKYLEYFKTGKFIYKVLDPLPTDGYGQDNIDRLMRKTREIMFDEYQKLRVELQERDRSVDDLKPTDSL